RLSRPCAFRVVAAACAAVTTASAAAEPLLPRPPSELENLRKVFSAAVAARDIARIAKLSHFPLAVDVYGSTPRLSEWEFMRDKQHFDGWFGGGDPGLARCLASQSLTMQRGKDFGAGAWSIDCSGNEYYFARPDGRWAFVAYQNINE
ncbi:MAG TPA: hypothetical protein VGG69_01525, partial [Rhizomicrobium sp.]